MASNTSPLHDLALVSNRRAAELTGLSISTLYRLRDRGEFPRPVPIITNKHGEAVRTGYRAEDIESWLRQRRLGRPVPSAVAPPPAAPRRPRGRPRRTVEG